MSSIPVWSSPTDRMRRLHLSICMLTMTFLSPFGGRKQLTRCQTTGLKQNKARYRAIKPTDDDDDIGLIGKLANITMPCYKCVPSPIFNLKLSHSAFIPAVSASQQRKRPRWSLRTKVYITIPVDQVVAPHVTSCHCKNSFRDSGRQAEVEEGGTTSSKTTKAES